MTNCAEVLEVGSKLMTRRLRLLRMMVQDFDPANSTFSYCRTTHIEAVMPWHFILAAY